MTLRTIRTACDTCHGAGEIRDERDMLVVCDGCLGIGFLHENAAAAACDVVTHERVEPMRVAA